MVADSPYESGDLVLTPVAGLVAGFLSSMLMLVAMTLVTGRAAGFPQGVIRNLGRSAMPDAALDGGVPALAIGLTAYLVIGSVLGLLHALCQQSAPNRALLGVGAFYGVAIWVAGRMVGGLLLTEQLYSQVRSFTWMFGCACFGVALGLCAVAKQTARPVGDRIQAAD